MAALRHRELRNRPHTFLQRGQRCGNRGQRKAENEKTGKRENGKKVNRRDAENAEKKNGMGSRKRENKDARTL